MVDELNCCYTFVSGYVYMNGDVGKLPSGAVYPTTPDALAAPAIPSTDYRLVLVFLTVKLTV